MREAHHRPPFAFVVILVGFSLYSVSSPCISSTMSFNRGVKRDSFGNRANFNRGGSGGSGNRIGNNMGNSNMGNNMGEEMSGNGGMGGINPCEDGMMPGRGILPTSNNNLSLASPQAQLLLLVIFLQIFFAFSKKCNHRYHPSWVTFRQRAWRQYLVMFRQMFRQRAWRQYLYDATLNFFSFIFSIISVIYSCSPESSSFSFFVSWQTSFSSSSAVRISASPLLVFLIFSLFLALNGIFHMSRC